MLKDETLDKLVVDINKKVNMPLLSEKMESIIIRWGILEVDRFLKSKNLSIENIIHSEAQGFNDDFAEQIKKQFIVYINKKIDIPFLSEKKEYDLFNKVVNLLFEYSKLENALNRVA